MGECGCASTSPLLRFPGPEGLHYGIEATRYVKARNQSDAARSIGDTRPFVMAAVPDGSQTLYRADELEAAVYAFVSEWAGE